MDFEVLRAIQNKKGESAKERLDGIRREHALEAARKQEASRVVRGVGRAWALPLVDAGTGGVGYATIHCCCR